MLWRKGNLLPIGEKIPYGYIGGTLEQRAKVDFWIEYMNYNFGFKFERTFSFGTFTIAFDNRFWNQSFSGLEGMNMKPEQSPYGGNMNLNSHTFNHTGTYEDYVIVHELFHIAGIEHGMQNPLLGPNYKPDDELAEVMRNQGYSEEQIEHELLPIDSQKYSFYEFDELSFMNYRIDCSWTIDGEKCNNSNWTTSEKDVNNLARALRSPYRRFRLLMSEWIELKR